MNSKSSKDLNEDCYNFTRGQCIIFNQMKFDDPDLKVRHGTNEDRDQCKKLFKSLNFDVQEKNDLTVEKIKDAIAEVAIEDHSKTDCLVVCFFSHGDQDMLYGYDGIFPVDELTDKFKPDECSGLAGKPKVFLIQACRGHEDDKGFELQKDSDDLMYRIPTTSDFLVCWASAPGYISRRNTTKGSWFIQSLIHIMKSQMFDDDLVSIMTKVNSHMTDNFETKPVYDQEGKIKEEGKKKQCATIVSTLRRKVKFCKSKN